MTRQELIDTLVKNGDLFLGGSRYFNKYAPAEIPITENTDWDFNIQFGIESTGLLKGLGFHKLDLSKHPYKDVSAFSLWHHREHTGISVIERLNLKAYITVFTNIDPYFYAQYMWKSNPRRTEPIDVRKIRDYIDAAYNLVKYETLKHVRYD